MADRLAQLLCRLRERFPAGSASADVEAFLSSEGYNRREIGEILTAWAAHAPPMSPITRPASSAPAPFRVAGPHEIGRFAPDAWGHLLSLAGAGTLGAGELESVIERALSNIDGRVALEDLRHFLDAGGADDLGVSPDHGTIH